ncbi:MAG: ABC transporter permease subunit [Bauldia sp.]|nr:ABC transporter permease subunit [Bauldia sp.]
MGFLEAIVSDIGSLAVPALFNVYFAVASIPVGFVLAVLLALARHSRRPVLSRFAAVYIYAFRGSPLFIQLFMVYSLMLSLNLSLWRPWGVDGFVLHPLFLGPLVLTLNTTAYTAEIIFGALRTVPQGELDAARAYGMSPWRQFRSVIWPNTIRVAWPAYTNEVVFLFQATALVYFALPVVDQQRDLMSKATDLFYRDFNVFAHYAVAAGYFLVISWLIFVGCGAVNRRLNAHVAPQRRVALRYAPKYLR